MAQTFRNQWLNFSAIRTLLIEQGYVTLETYFVDGTKVEANANRYTYVYTYVWKKSVAGNKTKLEAAIRELLRQIAIWCAHGQQPSRNSLWCVTGLKACCCGGAFPGQAAAMAAVKRSTRASTSSK